MEGTLIFAEASSPPSTRTAASLSRLARSALRPPPIAGSKEGGGERGARTISAFKQNVKQHQESKFDRCWHSGHSPLKSSAMI